jgi:hypothetical protein
MKISTFMGAPKDLNLTYVVERDIFGPCQYAIDLQIPLGTPQK